MVIKLLIEGSQIPLQVKPRADVTGGFVADGACPYSGQDADFQNVALFLYFDKKLVSVNL